MTRYEYRSLTAGDVGDEDLDARMNEYAAEGWRLVGGDFITSAALVEDGPHHRSFHPRVERQLHSDRSEQSVTTTYP